ncbi:MAG: phytoene desaturase family protein [Actinomycetota bacterium]|nr:NAD(P)/FAD-dependent oxidoreductase [Actinomycetota bacterium]
MNKSAVIVGAGHNGLVAACLLAKRGVKVTVLERRDVVGGACVTEELIPGFRVSTAAYSFSLFRPEIVKELDLERHGLAWYSKEPRMFVPLPDGRSLYVWRDAARTVEEIRLVDEKDADAWPRWNAFWDEVAGVVRPLVLDPEPPTLAELETELDRRGKSELFRLAIAGSAADTVRRFFRSDAVQGMTASQGIIGTHASVNDPGTAFVMTYHAFGGELVDGAGTWAYVRGGMGGVTQALAACARSLGVRIITGAPASEIVVEGGRATGVRVLGGDEIRADLVFSNADPKRTFLHMLPSGTLSPAFEDRVASIDTRGSVIKVNLALDEVPDFLGMGGNAGPEHAGTIEISPSIDYLQSAFEDAHKGSSSVRPFMEVFIQSVSDPTLAPPGKHVASCFAQYAPAEINPDEWDLMREQAGDAVIDTLAGYAPNLKDAIIHREVLGPPELEARFGLTGGNIFHGEILPGQIFGERLGPRTPVRGLYLCGSGAHPGGGVTGAPGWNAARAALSDIDE